jgi:dCMP deaminase
MSLSEEPVPASIDSPRLLDQLAALVEGREERPSWDEYFMSVALLISLRSACDRLQVGCVLVTGGDQSNRIVAAGYNGFLPGAPHVSHVRDGHEQATVHAEQNAIADAARRGVSLLGATAYVSHFPCINCAKLLASSGIKVIKYHWDYRNDALAADLLQESGVTVVQF